jgi:hypothetical protein
MSHQAFVRWAAALLSAAGVAAAAGGCFFAPAIDARGYVACTDDAGCDPGFFCDADLLLCAPPEWNDTAFQQRRLLVVDNPSAFPLPAGTAIPVAVGGPSGLLALDEVGADARFTQFDGARWRVVGVYRDLFADRFVVWIPLLRPLAPGGKDALAWIEQGTSAGTPTVLESTSALPFFDDLDTLNDEKVVVVAPGAQPQPGGAGVNVGDNQKLIWRTELKPPLSVTFRARVNQLTCREVFLGLAASLGASFDPPSAGFFIDTDLLTVAEYAPTADSQVFENLDQPRIFAEQPNLFHRFTVTVDPDGLRLLVNDEVFGERTDLRPGFDDVVMYPTVAVGGACSVDVDAVWVSPLPVASPRVTAHAPIALNVTF